MAETDAEAKTVVVGLGTTGLSVARYLRRLGRPFRVVDSRESPPGLKILREEMPRTEIELGPFDEQGLLRAEELIVSPGVSLKTPAIDKARRAGLRITGDVALFAAEAAAREIPLIAVTGSNGKSTVVTLLAEMLREAGRKVGLGGNLETESSLPALNLLEGDSDVFLLELSSFQLETCERLNAEVAVILNMSEDHMDRYDNLNEYRDAKLRIFAGCRQAVVNRDDPLSAPPVDLKVPVRDFGFSRPGAAGVSLLEESGERYLVHGLEKIMPVSELKVVGRHNITNVMAAMALALSVDVDPAAMRRAASQFSGLPHRCQWIARKRQVDFYNDSKATNVGATEAAVEGLGEVIDGHVILIAGGQGKGADFQPLSAVLNRWSKLVILLGEDAMRIAAVLSDDCSVRLVATMEEAVKLALEEARPGDAVLLSPACASFDMFDNFRHRGRVFAEAVERLQ